MDIGTADFIHADDLFFDDLCADDKVERERRYRAQEVDHLFVYGMWI